MAAIGSAQFGSGLLSVTLGYRSLTEVVVRVIVGRVDARWFNTYYDVSVADADTTLNGVDASGNCTVTVSCASTGFNETTAAFNPDNDPLTYDSWIDLSTIEGDAVRYFVISGLDADTETIPDIVVSTTAVSSTAGGRLQSLTLSGAKKPTTDSIKLGHLSCVKSSYFDGIDNIQFSRIGSTIEDAFHGWDQDQANPDHDYGTPTHWTISSIDASGNVTVSDATGLANGRRVAVCATATGAVRGFGYVANLSGTDFDLVLGDGSSNAYLSNMSGATNLRSCEDEPKLGMTGLHMERMRDKGMNIFVGLEDSHYIGQNHCPRSVPPMKSGDAWGMGAITGRDSGVRDTTINYDRTTATANELNLLQHARIYFTLPQVIETLQSCVGVFNRGDHDLTYTNNHSFFPSANSVTPSWTIDPTSTTTHNPMTDGTGDPGSTWIARIQNVLSRWENYTDVWNLYFAAGNPLSLLSPRSKIDYPPTLTKDSSGVVGNIDPVATYGADSNYFIDRSYKIENAHHLILVPDSQTHRGGDLGSPAAGYGSYVSGVFQGNEYAGNFYDDSDGSFNPHANYVTGGESVFGPEVEAAMYREIDATPNKTLSILSKGVMLDHGGDINPDSNITSAVDETVRVKNYCHAAKTTTLIAAGDNHIAPDNRATEGRTVEAA